MSTLASRPGSAASGTAGAIFGAAVSATGAVGAGAVRMNASPGGGSRGATCADAAAVACWAAGWSVMWSGSFPRVPAASATRPKSLARRHETVARAWEVHRGGRTTHACSALVGRTATLRAVRLRRVGERVGSVAQRTPSDRS